MLIASKAACVLRSTSYSMHHCYSYSRRMGMPRACCCYCSYCSWLRRTTARTTLRPSARARSTRTAGGLLRPQQPLRICLLLGGARVVLLCLLLVVRPAARAHRDHERRPATQRAARRRAEQVLNNKNKTSQPRQSHSSDTHFFNLPKRLCKYIELLMIILAIYLMWRC